MSVITNVEAIGFAAGPLNRLVVVIDTDSGHSGIGESGLTGRERAVIGALDHLRPLLVGQEAGRTEHFSQLLSRGGFFPSGPVIAAALSAVDIALWDLKGKELGVPVYELLGGLARDKVPCYPHNVYIDDDVDVLLESCLETTKAGWRFVRWGLPLQGDRIDPRRSIELGLRQLAAVRDALGDEIEICIDLHTRLDLPDALRFCREAEQYRPFFIEDPLRVENPEPMRQLRTRTSVPLAAGEQLTSKWGFRPLVEQGLIDYARVDVCLAGGITEAQKIAALCETHYVKLATHNPLGPVSSAACLHLNLSTSNVAVQEQPRQPGTTDTDLFPVQVPWAEGFLLPPTTPGLGIEFDREAARARPMGNGDLAIITREDGSFTNW